MHRFYYTQRVSVRNTVPVVIPFIGRRYYYDSLSIQIGSKRSRYIDDRVIIILL